VQKSKKPKMMKCHIIALFIAGVAILQEGASCDEQQRLTRTLKAKKIPKEKKSSKSSKLKVKKEVAPPVEGDDSSISSINVAKSCTSIDDCKGHGHGSNYDCWFGECKMCVPSSHEKVFTQDFSPSGSGRGKCRCARNGGGDDGFDVWVQEDGYVSNVDTWPPMGGQFRKRCNECLRRMEADGVIEAGASCSRNWDGSMDLKNMNVNPLWKSFGPPNHSNEVGRYPANCIPNSDDGEGCKLRCGKHKDSQMYIYYNPYYWRGGSINHLEVEKVWGLPKVLGDWVNGCNVCGNELQRTGFIEGGWECKKGIVGVNLRKFTYRFG